MERKTPQSIGDVLRATLQATNMQGRLDEQRAADLWQLVVGPAIAAAGPRPKVENGTMTVRIPNPALRQELNMTRSRLAEAINRELGKNVINNIRFLS